MTTFLATIANIAAPDETKPPLYLGIDNSLLLKISPTDDAGHILFGNGGPTALRIDFSNLLPREVSQQTTIDHGAFTVGTPTDAAPGQFILTPPALPCALPAPVTIKLSGIVPPADGKMPGRNLILASQDASGKWTEACAPLALSPVTPEPIRPEAAWAQSKTSVPTSEAEADDAQIASSRTVYIKRIRVDPKGVQQPTFQLSFDVAESKNAANAHQALATESQIKNIKVSCSGDGRWQLDPALTGARGGWVLTRLGGSNAAPEAVGSGQARLADEGESVAVTMDRIVTTLPPFLSELTIHYEGIHGCPPGTLILDIEKVPARPTVLRFDATDETGKPCMAPIYPGQEITLTWEAEGTGMNATPVRLVSSEPNREWDLFLARKGSIKVHPTGGMTGQAIYDLSLEGAEPGVSKRRILSLGALTADLKSVPGPVTRGDEISLSYAMDYVGEYQLQPDVIPATRIPATKGLPRVADVRNVKVLEPTTFTLTARGGGQPLTRSVSVGIKPYLPEKGIYIAMDDAIWLIHPDLSLERVVDHVETRTLTDLVAVSSDHNNNNIVEDYLCWGHAYHAELHYAKLDGTGRAAVAAPAPILSMARGWQGLLVLLKDGRILQTSNDPRYVSDFQPVSSREFNGSPLSVQLPLGSSHLRTNGGRKYNNVWRYFVDCRAGIVSGLRVMDGNGFNQGWQQEQYDDRFLPTTSSVAAMGAFVSSDYVSVPDNQFLWIDGARNMLCLATLNPNINEYGQHPVSHQDCCPASPTLVKAMGLGVPQPMNNQNPPMHVPAAYWIETLPNGKSALFRFRWLQDPRTGQGTVPSREQILTLPGTPGGNGIAVIV